MDGSQRKVSERYLSWGKKGRWGVGFVWWGGGRERRMGGGRVSERWMSGARKGRWSVC